LAKPSRLASGFAALLVATVTVLLPAGAGLNTAQASYPTVSGAGSTWVAIALDQWRADIAHQGLLINYQANGSSAGRSLYITDGVDFAASEIPFQPDELNELTNSSSPRHWQYMPDVAGGTSLMYNLHTPTGNRITSLRLNADAAAKIFTGKITTWGDPEIAALNPGLQIRSSDMRVIPVIRSDGSGTSAQFSLYLADQAPAVWNPFAATNGCPAPCSVWPYIAGAVAANGSDSVANDVANDAIFSGAIGYVEAGYAFGRGFPVASLHNASGNYTQPTSQNVATALTHATLYADLTQNLVGVYRAPESNAYAMSSYSYMILPCVVPSTQVSTCSTTPPQNFDASKGFVLGTWILYIACAGQREAAPLGYSPLPPNLVQADFNAVSRLPGHPPIPPLDYNHCPNPTLFKGGGGGTTSGPTPHPSAGASPTLPVGGSSPTPGTVGSGPGGGGGPTAGGFQVTILGAASRARLLDSAIATAAVAAAPPYTPLWVALSILLLVVFTPMVIATFLRARRRKGDG
jgi:phosphate transport system substrate-binding protein